MASFVFVPDSMHSFLAGAVRTNFGILTTQLERDPVLQAHKAQSPAFFKSLLEELFRYLYLLAADSADGAVRSAPSHIIRKAHVCLVMDPVLYFQVCDEILTLQGQTDRRVRVLPSNPIEEDAASRTVRFMNTKRRYKQIFGHDPPVPLWSEGAGPSGQPIPAVGLIVNGIPVASRQSQTGVPSALPRSSGLAPLAPSVTAPGAAFGAQPAKRRVPVRNAAPVAAPAVAPGTEPVAALVPAKKSSMTTLWEITVRYVVGRKELTEHEGTQVIQCWCDAELISGSAEKMEGFKRLLGMKFGAKGRSLYDLMIKMRDETIQMIQQKQQQRRQQAEVGGSNSTPGSVSNSQAPSQSQAQHRDVLQRNPAFPHNILTQVSALRQPQSSHSSPQPRLSGVSQQQQQQPLSPVPSTHPFVPPKRADLSTSAESSDHAELPARKRHKAATRNAEWIDEEDVGESCEIGGVIDLTDPYSEGREIIVKCKYHFGEDIFVIMNPLTPMEELMLAVAKRVDRPLHALHFLVDGIRMTPSFTWESWRMDNGAEVVVMLSSVYR